MVLILDVARFKYPPHWVPLPLLYQSMNAIDAETGKSRGYLLLSVKSVENGGGIQVDCNNCCMKMDNNEIASEAKSTSVSAVVLVDDDKEVVDFIPQVEAVKQQCVDDLKSLFAHSCELCSST